MFAFELSWSAVCVMNQLNAVPLFYAIKCKSVAELPVHSFAFSVWLTLTFLSNKNSEQKIGRILWNY